LQISVSRRMERKKASRSNMACFFSKREGACQEKERIPGRTPAFVSAKGS